MRTKFLAIPCIVVFITVLSGCAQLKDINFRKPVRPLESFAPYDLASESQSIKYIPKIDSFVIILDASDSMDLEYTGMVNKGHPKFIVAKDIIARMNATLPEMDVKYGFVTFGHEFYRPLDKTDIVSELTKYSRNSLESTLSLVTSAEGSSPAGAAITDAGRILLTSGGEKVVLLVSDGEMLIGSPLTKVKELNDLYEEHICFYTIHVGNTPESKQLMKDLAREAKCGFSISADEIASREGMANFVKEVFLTAVARVDSDGDGVYDEDDECPGTPEGAIVDFRGCWVVKDITFEYKKWDIREEFSSNLDNVVTILNKNPTMKIRIAGHTDNIGSMGYNMDLSQKRAGAVRDYLVKMGISESRLSTIGFGYTKPVATNDTEEGRSLNRRAELLPIE
ncbi:MAG: OmpA family protein [Candidatus Brocadiaceae bacterium]|nr:OmpA family protein [Candidatus Brocadiaceae bacterium]